MIIGQIRLGRDAFRGQFRLPPELGELLRKEADMNNFSINLLFNKIVADYYNFDLSNKLKKEEE